MTVEHLILLFALVFIGTAVSTAAVYVAAWWVNR